MLTSSFVGGELHSCPPQHTLRHRPPDILPTCDNGAEDMDNLDDVCICMKANKYVCNFMKQYQNSHHSFCIGSAKFNS
jgi:hypothetical protein